MTEDLQSGTGFQPVSDGENGHGASPSSRVIAEHPPVEIVENRDDHTRVWEISREVETTHPDGSTTVDTIKSYIHEKASGLCYKDASGAYVPSLAEWRETPDGFVIDRCPYRLVMGKTIGTSARYTVEGNDLLLRPAYLIISDGVNEADPRLLTPQTPGSISPDNPSILRFPSAFGEGYDLEYVAEKGGFHQNLIIAGPPQLPHGFNSPTASIHLYTELNLDQYLFSSGAQVMVEGEPVNTSAADLVTEPSRNGCISFTKDGRLLHAFSVSQVSDSSGPGALDKQTAAEKRLMKDSASGKSYLVESLPISYFTDNSPTYPITWDYHQKSGALNNDETWCPRYTYYVSSTLTIATGRTLTIEPGTVVKLKGQSTQIAVSGKLIAVGEPYNYVSFTSAHDDDCGEDLDGPGKPLPEASPQEGDYYAAFVLASGEVTLRDSQAQYCKVGYGTSGAVATVSPYEMGHDIRDCIFRKCVYGLVLCAPTDSEGPAAVRNNLFFDVGVAITLYGASYLGIYNNTFDGPGKASDIGVWFWAAANGVQIKYNIFTNLNDAIDNGTISEPTIDYNAFYQTPSEDYNAVLLGATPFESSPGLGDHYLNKGGAGQACRVGGWTARPHDVGLGDRRYTVNKPIPANANITESVSWNIIDNALNESAVALGYHHNRVDYNVTTDVTVSPHPETGAKTVLTICPAVVVCVGDTSIQRTLKAHQGCTITCVGNPQQQGYNVITTCPTASMKLLSKTLSTGYPGVVKVDSTASAGCRFAYTRFLRKSRLYLNGKCSSPIDSNRFEYAYYGLYKTVPAEIRNNLFYACLYGVYSSGDADGHTLSCSNTFDHCDLGYAWSTGASSPSTTVRDCLFSKCLYGIYASVLGGAALEESYNGFWKIDSAKYWKNGQTQPLHLTDVSLDPLECPYDRPPGNYGDGPKENDASWYLDQTADWKIVDDGSCDSIDAGLDIFTTAANYKPDFGIGDARTLDIGYHYPIDASHTILHPGYRQTDIALRWNNMTDGCLRAFSFDGHTGDEIGNADAYGSDLRYGYYRYAYGYPGGIKFDYNKAAQFYYNSLPSDADMGNAPDIRSMQTGTISVWVCPHTMGDNGDPTLYYKRANSGETEAKWLRLSTVEGPRRLQGTVAPAATVTSDAAVSLNAWHHAAMTWDFIGSDRKVRLYLDGEFRGSSDANGGAAQDSENHAYIGARKYEQQPGQFYEDNHFDGFIADVFIYNRPLELDEIRWLACKTHDGWLVTPNFGAMGEFPQSPPNPPGPEFPLGQFQSADWAVQSNDSDPHGKSIWVNEHGAQRVTKLSLDGVVIGKIGGSKGRGNDQLWDPYGIAIDSENNVYVVNNGTSDPNYPDATRVSVFSPQGAFLRSWGGRGSGDGQFIFPYFMAVDSTYAYVGDNGNHRVQKFNKNTGAYVCQWGQAPSDPYNRGPYEFYELRGIAIDSQGYVWVCDRGPTGNVSYLKKFDSNGNFQSKIRVDRLSPYGTYNDYCSGIGILNEGGTDYIYSSGGEMVYCDHIAKWWVGTQEDGDPVSTFNFFGAGNDQSYAPWGGYPAPDTPPGTDHRILSTCWFACKLELWKPDGTWLNTFRSGMRSDAYSIKCKNTSAAVKYLYQQVNLEQSTYTVQFLAFTNGSDLSQNQDVLPYAERAVGNEPTNNNAITSPSYAEGVLTYVDIPPGNRLYYFVSGAFQVQEGQSGDWFVGIQVKAGTTTYVASLSCLKQ